MQDVNNITAKGYYYYLDENGGVVVLDTLGAGGNGTMLQWDQVEAAERASREAVQNFNEAIRAGRPK